MLRHERRNARLPLTDWFSQWLIPHLIVSEILGGLCSEAEGGGTKRVFTLRTGLYGEFRIGGKSAGEEWVGVC